MTSDAAIALRDLRDALRQPIATIDDFTFLLSSTLSSLDLHPTSSISSLSSSDYTSLKAIDKHLPAVQQALLNSAVPNFLHALDDRGRQLLDTFFCPDHTGAITSTAARHVALYSYWTLPALLSAKPGITPLPIPSRQYLLDTLQRLFAKYGIHVIYDTIWTSSGQGEEGSKEEAARQIAWEDAVRAAVSLPAKVGNAVGVWKGEGWQGDAPEKLVPRTYFNSLIGQVDELILSLSQAGSPEAIPRLRFVLERLAAVGLLVPKASRVPLYVPSLWPVLLPRMLPRLASGSSPYDKGLLRDLTLSLPAPTLFAFVSSLLSHLTLYGRPAEPSAPDSQVKVATQALTATIGPAVQGEEACDAVLRSVFSHKASASALDPSECMRTSTIVNWIAAQGEKAVIPFIDALLDKWCDAKWVKFTLFSSQFQIAHMLLLAFGHLRPFHPHLIALSTSARFIIACQAFLAHPDASVRRLGMLVAEILSELTIPDEPVDGMDDKDETEELMRGLEIGGEVPAGANSRGGPKGRKGVKRLRFGADMWDGHGDGKDEARWLRQSVGVDDAAARLPTDSADWLLGWDQVDAKSLPDPNPHLSSRGRTTSPRSRKPTQSKAKPRQKPKVIMLDQEDDPLSGYSSESASSSRSPSPTPSYLEEVAQDPSLALDGAQKKKVQRPVYVSQLLALLRDKDNPDAIEMGLKYGEALVRAKRSFGTEVSENAINLVAQLVGLNDPFNIEGFDNMRDALTRAVVACAPKQAAPYLSEQYFSTHYSLQQKSVMLNALAMAARELAGLSVPEAPPFSRRIDFPTKTLPIALHQQYISPADQAPRLANRPMNQIDMVTDEVRGILLSKGAKRAEEEVPDIARQKRLRVGARSGQSRGAGVAEEGTLASRQMAQQAELALQAQAPKPVIPYREVAAEYFILPLINLFWQAFRDASFRESRAMAAGSSYRGAGTGMVLSPLALERFLLTLSLLVHAARNSSVFLAVIIPEALELAVTIGSKHFTRPEDHMLEPRAQHDGSTAESQVVAPALELALVCLDGAVEVDKGRSLAVDRSDLVLAAGEWAQGVFDIENRGGKVSQGQAKEGKIRAAAAGVVVKVAEIAEKWTQLGAAR